MTSITCFAASVLAVLSIPFLLLYRATESIPQRARRMRANKVPVATIAKRLGRSPSTIYRYCR